MRANFRELLQNRPFRLLMMAFIGRYLLEFLDSLLVVIDEAVSCTLVFKKTNDDDSSSD